MQQLVDTLKDAVGTVKSVLDVDSVIGRPIVDAQCTIIPVTKMSVGFLSAGGETEGKYTKGEKLLPIGGLGGGANVTPLGFLIVEGNSRVKFLKIEKGEGDKWADYTDKIMDYLSRD